MGARHSVFAYVCACSVIAALPLPAEASDRFVPAGGDLQAAIDAAQPGDTIRLAAGATFVGNFTLPVHGGTAYVTIRSAAADSVLPAAGTRVTPADAPQLPKIQSPNTAPALATRPGAAYWRLQWLEFLPTHLGYYDIVTLGDGSEAQTSLAQVPHHLIMDRVYVHGDRLHGQKRGISINSGTTTIVNSHVSEIKAIGQDSVAVGGWNGPGPYTLENNYLEAAGEIFMLGGADPSIPDLVPSDILIQRNTLARPLSWRDGIVATPSGVHLSSGTGGNLPAGVYSYQVVALRTVNVHQATSLASERVSVSVASGSRITVQWDAVQDATAYQVYGRGAGSSDRFWTVTSTAFTDDGTVAGVSGAPPSAPTVWQVKNLLELKNARRVRIVGNLFQNNWAQAQTGTGIVLTPRNQDGRCRWCVVEDVAFEQNVVRGTGAGISILGWDDEKPSQQLNAIRIRNNVFSDMGYRWGGSGYFLLLLGEPRDVIVDHNTIVADEASGVIAVDGQPVAGFVFTNNIARHHAYGILGTGGGVGSDTISAFLPGAVVTRNVLAGIPYPYSYPAGNLFPPEAEFGSHFVNLAGGNLALKPGTDWANAGTDGLDLGASLGQGQPAAATGPKAPVNVRVIP